MSAFDKVIGYEKEKEELIQLCDMAKHAEKYAALGVSLPRGVLLHGVPGVGKTLMASALVEEMGRKCFTLRKDKSIKDFVDEIGKTFVSAKEAAPSVIFLDDLDKFASDSDSRNPEELIAVQSGIDEVKSCDVFVVATANEIRELPSSLRRPGRFDRILQIMSAQPTGGGCHRAPLSGGEESRAGGDGGERCAVDGRQFLRRAGICAQ